MIFEYTSYRSFLKAKLAERMAQNPRYSLRSFARQLKVSPAILSQAMNAKRNFSPRMAFQVAQNLNLPSAETKYFCLLAQYEFEKHPDLRAALHTQLEESQQTRKRKGPVPRDMDMEMFKLISEWYHIPIVEMTELTGFKFTALNVAKRLGISRHEASAAIERLERLKMIVKNADGRYQKANFDYEFNSEQMSEALNKFHRQMLTRAIGALDGQPRKQRQVISNTFSIDPKLLPRAQELVTRFRREMVELFNSGEANTETYHMGVQLFKLTETPKKRGKGT